jgi:hypothetical protein
MVTLVVVLAIAAGLQTMAWRAARGSQSQWDAQYATYASDAAIAQQLSTWPAELIAQTPIGVAQSQETPGPDNWITTLSVMRTGTLVATLQALTVRATALNTADPKRVSRRVTQYVSLLPPPLPVNAAATMLGPVQFDTAMFDGRDRLSEPDTLVDDCGPLRDSASLPALAHGTTGHTGLPTVVGAILEMNAPALASAQERFDRSWPLLVSRATPYPLISPSNVVSPAPWRALVIEDATTVTLRGVSAHTGLLLVNGDLDVQGELHITGALVVRGAMKVSSGLVDVRGALLVRDVSERGSHFNSTTSVQYTPCVFGRALAAVARPQFNPYFIRNSP